MMSPWLRLLTQAGSRNEMNARSGVEVQKELVRLWCYAAVDYPPSDLTDELTRPAVSHWQFCSEAALPEETVAAPSEIGSSVLLAAAGTAATVAAEAAPDETAAAEIAVEIASHCLAPLGDHQVGRPNHHN